MLSAVVVLLITWFMWLVADLGYVLSFACSLKVLSCMNMAKSLSILFRDFSSSEFVFGYVQVVIPYTSVIHVGMFKSN